MSNKTLFQEAIADAKTVREAALANAKAALEEALTPRLQSMLAMKLNEMEEEEMEEGMYPEDTSDEIQDRYRATGAALEEEDLDEELDLSAILAELEDEDTLDEAKDEESEEETEDEESEEETEDEESEEDVKIEDMTVEELKDLIKDIVSQEMGAEEAPADDMMGGEEEDMGAEVDDEEINLDELLAELDALGEEDEDMEKESMYEAKRKHEKAESAKKEKAEHASKKEKAEKSEMNEAISTIHILRKELNEVNLLNAKLLYVNKIFKSKNLTESQKVHVIASFDKATNVREAKVVFESLNTALAATKKPIKESLGFASKAAGIAPSKQPIVESNDAIARMQKLANIIK